MLGSLLGLSNVYGSKSSGYGSSSSGHGFHGSLSSGHGSHGSLSSGHGSLSSGYGSLSSGYESGNCCPLVVNTKSFLALLGFMALAVFFLNNVIEMSALPVRRKKRSLNSIDDVLVKG